MAIFISNITGKAYENVINQDSRELLDNSLSHWRRLSVKGASWAHTISVGPWVTWKFWEGSGVEIDEVEIVELRERGPSCYWFQLFLVAGLWSSEMQYKCHICISWKTSKELSENFRGEKCNLHNCRELY